MNQKLVFLDGILIATFLYKKLLIQFLNLTINEGRKDYEMDGIGFIGRYGFLWVCLWSDSQP
jgi:hypothetical protein